MDVTQVLAAKDLYEGRTKCPQCGVEFGICSLGWLFSTEAQARPVLEGVGCYKCDALWDEFDARRLVAAAQAVGAAERGWLATYEAVTTALREHVRAGHVVATAFGTFYTRRFLGYIGRNPRTGEAIEVPDSQWRAFAIDAGFAARVIPAPESVRPLRIEDLHDDHDVYRRPEEGDDGYEDQGRMPEPTHRVDVATILEVHVHELRVRGMSLLGQVGTFQKRLEHDEQKLYACVALSFARGVLPD